MKLIRVHLHEGTQVKGELDVDFEIIDEKFVLKEL